MSKDKYRARVHMLLLYPDNESHLAAFDKIKQSYDYASILHDRDYFDKDVLYTAADEKRNPEHKKGTIKYKKGDPKKDHIHIVLRTANATWNTALCKEIGLEEEFCEQAKNIDNALQYLLHYNDKDKAEYAIDEVSGSLKTKLIESINKIEKSEGEKVVELLEYICDHRGRITTTQFAHYCAKNGYWSEFRRSGAIFCRIIDEHNAPFEDKQKKA